MSNAISGLLTQKPDSPAPQPNSIARFSVEVRQKKSGDGTWNKLKNEKEGYGASFKVVKVDRIDDYTHPTHGLFHQYSLLIEPSSQEGAGAVASSGQSPTTGEVTAPAASTSSKKDDDIARAVAFKGAVEVYCAGSSVKENNAADATTCITALTDALLPIVTGESGNAPAPKVAPVDPSPSPINAPDGHPDNDVNAASNADDDIPF